MERGKNWLESRKKRTAGVICVSRQEEKGSGAKHRGEPSRSWDSLLILQGGRQSIGVQTQGAA